MNLSQVQKHLAARITAATALAALGDPYVLNPLSTYATTYDPGTAAIVTSTTVAHTESITARLQSAGVAIEIGWPLMSTVENTTGAVFAQVVVDVYAAEMPTVSHTPSGLALADAIIAAIKTRAASAWSVSITDYASDTDDHGALLHIFSAAITIRSA